jgi:integrase
VLAYGCANIRALLERLQKQTSAKVLNWTLIDLPLRRLTEQFASAREQRDFHLLVYPCSELVIALANVIEGQRPGIEAPQALQLLKDHIERHVSPVAQDLAQAARAVVESLYNKLQDKRSAALCVQAATTLVNVLAVEGGRNNLMLSLADLIDRMLIDRKLGVSHRAQLQRLARSQMAQKPVSELQGLDILNYCQQRKDQGISPATINQDVSYTRGVLKAARDDWRLEVTTDAVDEAKGLLERFKLVGKSTRRTRRPLRDDLERLLAFFRVQDKHPRTITPMAEITEFAMWSGRRISEICSLEWDRIDYEERRYRVSEKESFPLLGPVWTVIQRQPRVAQRIFPCNAKTASARYTLAKKKLGIADLRLNDLRLEAALRLRDAGHAVEDIAEVIGRKDLNALREDLGRADVSA